MNVDPSSSLKEEPSRFSQRHDYLGYQLRVVLRLGKMLLGAGASSFRVKDSMGKLAHAVGIEHHQAMVTLTEIVATAAAGGTFRTEMAEQRAVGVNADLIDRLGRFTAQLKDPITVEEADEALTRIQKQTHKYSALANMFASGAACAGFAFLNGETPLQLLAVFIAASIGQFLRRILLHRGYNHMGVWMVSGTLASSIYIAFLSLVTVVFPSVPLNHTGVVAAVLFLVPGFPLLTSLLELIRLDLSAGIQRLVYSTGLIVSVGVALWITTMIIGWHPINEVAWALPKTTLIPLQIIASFVAAYGFAMLFNAPAGACLGAGLIGTAVNVPRILLTEAGMPSQVAIGLASLMVGLLAAAIAAKTRFSRVSLSVPAAVIMIPGSYLYQALTDLNNGEVSAAATALSSVIFTVLAIAAGLGVARMLTDRHWLIDNGPVLPRVHNPGLTS